MSIAIVVIILFVLFGLMMNLFEAFRRAKPPTNFKKRDDKEDEH